MAARSGEQFIVLSIPLSIDPDIIRRRKG